jgi:hypothetical protein
VRSRSESPKTWRLPSRRPSPDDDKAAAVLHLIEAEIARRQDAEGKFEDIVQEVLRVRQEPPYFTDEDIRRIREELRK